MSMRPPLNANIERLIGEALIDARFREQLLTDPLSCARQLALSDEEPRCVMAARAPTLREFAAQLHRTVYGATPHGATSSFPAA